MGLQSRQALIRSPECCTNGFSLKSDLFRADSLARNQMRIDAIDEGQVTGCEFVVSDRDTPTLLHLVEEQFDQAPRSIQIWG
jgi:hypothetical protein